MLAPAHSQLDSLDFEVLGKIFFFSKNDYLQDNSNQNYLLIADVVIPAVYTSESKNKKFCEKIESFGSLCFVTDKLRKKCQFLKTGLAHNCSETRTGKQILRVQKLTL